MAKKNHDSPTKRKPVRQRWYYDATPVITAQHLTSGLKKTGEISLLTGRVADQLTLHEGSPERTSTTDRIPTNGELSFAEPLLEYTQVQNLTYSVLDWVSAHHRDPFIVVLEFPNAIDPDNPIDTIKGRDLKVFTNQTVPNLYLQISQLTGIFPSCINLMVSGNVLRHTGLISATECKAPNGVIMGKSPMLSDHTVVTVVMLCTNGMEIPQGYDDSLAGFPVSYPPDGMTRCDAPDGMPSWDSRPLVGQMRPLNHTDVEAQQFYWEVRNPPDSDDSESEELTDAELVEAITCINTVDLWGESAIRMMTSNPGFTILRTGNGTALVLFPDRQFRVFFTCDIDDAYFRMWTSSKEGETTDPQGEFLTTPVHTVGAESQSRGQSPTVFKQRTQIAAQVTVFNSRERFYRRLYTADMKAVWDYDHQVPRIEISGNDSMKEDMEFATYLDFITEKLRVYDDDYAARLTMFKAEIASKTD